MIEHKKQPPPKLHATTFWVCLIFVVGLISRLMLVLFYQPVAFSDTPSYRRLAGAVLNGFVKYDGTRTPGYPVFLALVGSDQRVWIAQLLLGFLTTFLLFYMGWKITGKPWFGGCIALAHNLNLGQLFFESNLLTESLTTFLLILSLVGMLVWLLYPHKRNPWLAFFIGLISALTLLVRPLFIYLPFFLLLFLWLGIKQNLPSSHVKEESGTSISKHHPLVNKNPLLYIIPFVLPVALLLGGWIIFIHQNYGDWSLTTMTGYHLVQHTGSFFEYVPDEYASIRGTYIQYRDAHISEHGTQTNTIWDAIPEMSLRSGYNFYDLSRVLTKISLQLIREHPFLFLKSALSGWWMFWRTSVYWSADALCFPAIAPGVNLVMQIQRLILFAFNLIFIFSSLYFTICEFLANVLHKHLKVGILCAHPARKAYLWLLMGAVWIASILQTLLDHGDNPRFLIPLQSLVVCWVAWFFFLSLLSKRMPSNSTSLKQD
jgi:hypothetical protein